jgi:hypothetical protein
LDQDKLNSFIKEENILQRVKIESYLLPLLSLRPASQITIPAEFPKGVEMGQTIDEKARPFMSKLQTIKDPRKKMKAIRDLKKLLNQSFEEVVEDSETYKEHCGWAENLGLKIYHYQVRPTVYEIYYYRRPPVRIELRKLMNQREKLRQKAQRNPNPELGGIYLAYPEEFDEKWILNMGKLLGYPECCSKRYAKDRVSGINVEKRAADQLNQKITKKEQADPHAYPFSYFFPCEPLCENAIKRGENIYSELIDFDPRIGSIYEKMLRDNLNMVLKQPEIIQKYIKRIKSK